MLSVAAPLTRLRVHAPAKLNLHLELLGKRADGYHDLETVMVAIDLCDEIEISRRSDSQTTFSCRFLPHQAGWVRRCGANASPESSSLPEKENNLAWKAIEAFREKTGFSDGIDVQIRKRIPMGAGLGGASADAAGILFALKRLSGMSNSDVSVLALAEQLGSDVPFLLQAASGGMIAAVATGRGERLRSIETVRDLCFVVAYPPHPVSTRKVYERSKLSPRVAEVDKIIAVVRDGRCRELHYSTHNRLKAPACELEPRIVRCLEMLRRAGSVHAEMTGSGSACFAFAANWQEARRIAKRLRGQGMGVSFPCRLFLPSRI